MACLWLGTGLTYFAIRFLKRPRVQRRIEYFVSVTKPIQATSGHFVTVTKTRKSIRWQFCEGDEMTDEDQTTPKAPGRPRKGGTPMSPAERQKAYKMRRQRAVHDAIALVIEHRDANATPTAVLLDALAWATSQIDASGSEAGRAAAKGIVAELSRRYDLNRDGDENQEVR